MKKILILTSSSGGGHLSVSKALATYLENDYIIENAFIFKEVLKQLDIVRRLTFDKYSGEDFYNYFISKKNFLALTQLYKFGKWYIKSHRKKIYHILESYIQGQKPDLIISVVPLINSVASNVANNLHIPFLLVTADLDAQTYFIESKTPNTEKFKTAVPFDDPEIIHSVLDIGILRKQIAIIGAVLRSDFFATKNIFQLKKEFNVPENKSVIMLLMGGQGSNEIITFTKELSKLDTPIHLLVCIGKNENCRNQIEQLSFPIHISHSTIGFTQRISDLMAISDLLITKSGPQTICEAIYSNLPMLLDGTTSLLPWEKFNLDFIQKYNFGDVIKKHKNIAPQVTSLLQSNELKKYKTNLEKFEKKNGGEEVKKLIKEILS